MLAKLPLAALFVLAAALPGWAQLQPRLSASTDVFNFGEVWEGKPVAGQVTIRNLGQAALTLDIKSSCGCTLVSKAKSPLPPGETTRITISYDTKRHGPANRKVTIKTNDPQNPEHVVRVVGNVKPIFEQDFGEGQPRMLLFRELDPDAAVTRVVKLTNQYPDPVHLKLLNQERPNFKAALREVSPGQEYELHVQTTPPLEYGWTNDRVIFETGLPETPTIEMKLTIDVPARVAVVPNKMFVTPETIQPDNRTVRVRYRSSEPLRVTGVDVLPATMPSRVTPPGAATSRGKVSTYEFKVQLPDFDAFPASGAKIVIHTDDPRAEYKLLEIPITKRGRRG